MKQRVDSAGWFQSLGPTAQIRPAEVLEYSLLAVGVKNRPGDEGGGGDHRECDRRNDPASHRGRRVYLRRGQA
jgi:hypothetical protein